MQPVSFNAESLLARQWLRRNGDAVQNSMQRLSTGLRINSAADAPSDVARLNAARAQVRTLRQALENVQGALSMIGVQDAALGQVQDALLRIRDLALHASNEALLAASCEDRTRLNNEVQDLKTLINRLAEGTTFNGKRVIGGNPIQDITASNPTTYAAAAMHPTWNSAGTRIAFESDKVLGTRYPGVNAWRIWSDTPVSSSPAMMTPDPANAPADSDGDGFVNHPLSDPMDGNALYPNAPDTDGDGWPDPIDSFPADPLYPANFVDSDGDGYINHPLIDANDADPSTPTNVDADGDGYVDHPWMDPNDANPNIPNPTLDSDGDGIIDYYDRKGANDYSQNPLFPLAPDTDGDGIINNWDNWAGNPNLPMNPPDSDGDGEIDVYDPFPANPLLNAASFPDADGDGWPTAMDPNDADPLNPGGAPADTDADGYIDFYDPWPANPAANNANPLDTDGDGAIDFYDNWPANPLFPNNPDTDGDGVVDYFDYNAANPLYPLNPPDGDGDTIPDDFDPQPGVANNIDSDGDGVFDIFDPQPANPNYPVSTDADNDGYPDDAPGVFDPDPGSNQYPSNLDTDGDGVPDILDPSPGNASIPGPNPGDADGDGFADHPLFDMDPANPLVPFDNSIDADADGYPWYIDGGPGNPGADDTNPYMPVAAISFEDRDPDWSGSGIAYSSNRNTWYTSVAAPYVTDIFVTSGGVTTAITNDAVDDTDPAWSSDDSYLAWNRNGDIYIVEMSGGACTTGPAGVPALLAAGGESPVWHPREDTVFFVQGGVFMYQALGDAAPTQLKTASGAPIAGTNPAFLPSGDAILYASAGNIYYYDFFTRQQLLVTGAIPGGDYIDVSPDGKSFVYSNAGLVARMDLEVTYKPTTVQAGTQNDSAEQMSMYYADARTGALGISKLSVGSQADALAAIDLADSALKSLSAMRSQIGVRARIFNTQLGAIHESIARMSEYTANLGDTDVAAEAAALARAQILQNSAAAQLTQAGGLFAARARALLSTVNTPV